MPATNTTISMLDADRTLRLALGALPGESIRDAAGRVAVSEPKGTRRHLLAKEILFGEGDDRACFWRAAAMATPAPVEDLLDSLSSRRARPEDLR